MYIDKALTGKYMLFAVYSDINVTQILRYYSIALHSFMNHSFPGVCFCLY